MPPTADQLDSRRSLAEFLAKVSKPMRDLGVRMKSAWFGRPDAELQGWIARGRAIAEIADSMGYRLIVEQTNREIEWAREQLEIGKLNEGELRGYLKAMRFFHDFIITVERNADIAGSVLAGRERAIGLDSHDVFIQNAQVRP